MDDDLAFREARISIKELAVAGLALAAVAAGLHLWGERAVIAIGAFTAGYITKLLLRK